MSEEGRQETGGCVEEVEAGVSEAGGEAGEGFHHREHLQVGQRDGRPAQHGAVLNKQSSLGISLSRYLQYCVDMSA